MSFTSLLKKRNWSQENLFMVSAFIVNGGNYMYNLLLGRVLGPEQFADAAILITLLLVLSFIAMTFQLVAAKFSVTISKDDLDALTQMMYKKTMLIGVVLGLIIVVLADQLQQLFHTSSSVMFVVFGCGVPFYFLMSVNRGFFQGNKQFLALSITYQSEMVARLMITLVLIWVFKNQSALVIAVGILISLFFGLFPFKLNFKVFQSKKQLPKIVSKQINNFFAITAFYELSQIIINNSDILLVKHYFESYEAGLYASLALIGRIVYFIAWMFVMLLLPTVVQLNKEGKSSTKVLLKYVMYIGVIATSIIAVCAVFPTLVVQTLFGEQYISIAPLLWKYALATGVFAVANIFAYYFLSLDTYIPVFVSAIFGILQVVLIIFYHNSLVEVVHMQMITMCLLLCIQLLFFFVDSYKTSASAKTKP